MEAAEKYHPHTQGTFAHAFVRSVMDEVETGNEQRIRDAINLAEHGHRGGLIGALEKVKQDETRRRIRERLPQSSWVDGIQDHDILAAHGILQDFEERKIGLVHVDTYVREHPMTKTGGLAHSPISALRELARKMSGQQETTLRDVLEKIKNGLSPTEAWKQVVGKTRL